MTRAYKAGEMVVQHGQVLTETNLEALETLGLIQPQITWENLANAGALVLLVIAFMFFYLQRQPQLAFDLRGMALIALLFLSFLLGARFIIPGHVLLPYIYPLAAFALTAAVLFGREVALITYLLLVLLTTFDLPNALDLTLFYSLAGLFGVLAVGRARRLTPFFGAGAAIAGVGAVVAIAYRLPDATLDWVGVANLTGSALLNGIASASLAVLLQFYAGPDIRDDHRPATDGNLTSRPPLAADGAAQRTGHLSAQPAGGQPGRAGRRTDRRRHLAAPRRGAISRYWQDAQSGVFH